jgi:hypothetical protein
MLGIFNPPCIADLNVSKNPHLLLSIL